MTVTRRAFLSMLTAGAACLATTGRSQVIASLIEDFEATDYIAYVHTDAYEDLVHLPEGEIGGFLGFRIVYLDRDELGRRYPPRDVLFRDFPRPRRRRDPRGAQWKWERLPHHQRWA